MINYNYLNLSPVEFEELSRDVLQIREGIIFESFNSNKDGGIDFRFKTAESYIIVQAKRYNRYSDLRKDLIHKEVAKLKKRKPNRYILVTSVDFTITQKDELMKILKEHILHENDILGKRDLNNLLGLSEYRSIIKKHYKLWFTSIETLHGLIEQIVYRKDYNLTKSEWHLIHQECKFYVQNESFQEAVDKIEDDRIVLISGTPGSGKTTLGRALVGYFQAKEEYNDLIFIRDIDHAWAMLKDDEKQIFFYDDFLGAIRFGGFSRNEESILSRFIERIKIIPNKILILTTREYVLQQAQTLHSELKKDIYQLSKCIVAPETYTPYIKAKILYNHLYFSGLHPNQILTLVEKDNYRTIINHRNYTPRLIADHIKISAKNKNRTQYFYSEFIKYLNDPNEFWKDIYEKQSTSAKVLLITLFSLNEPIYLDDLKRAFDSAIAVYVNKYTNTIISPDTFRNTLQELSDTFIRIELENTALNLYAVEFQSPFIKDFILEYLREHQDWISVVINGSIFLNQFIFAFSTREQKLQDHAADDPVYGNKIVLKGDLCVQFKNRFLREFDSLVLSTIDSTTEFAYGKNRYTSSDNLLILKLLKLDYLFGMEDVVIRDFILSRFHRILYEYELERKSEFVKILSYETMMDFPFLVETVMPYTEIDSRSLLAACYDSITFTREFLDLHELGKLFPDDFDELMKEKGDEIKHKVEKLLLEDVEYFDSELMDIELDSLFDHVYDDVFDLYHLEKSDAFEELLHEMVDRPSWTKSEQKEWQARRKEEYKAIKKAEKDIDGVFTSLQAAYSHSTFQSTRDLNAYLKQISTEYGGTIVGRIKRNKHTFVDQFLDNEILVMLLVAYFKVYSSVPKSKTEFWVRMYDIMSEKFSKRHSLSRQEIFSFFSSLAFQLSLAGLYTFDKKMINKLCKTSAEKAIFDAISRSEAGGDPFLFETGEWFQFATSELQIYLTASTVSKLNAEEKKSFYLKITEEEVYHQILERGFELWRFLLEVDFSDFVKYYIVPELTVFFNGLDFSNDRSLVQSFCKMVNPNFDYTLSAEGDLKEFSCGNSYATFFDLLNVLDISFDPSEISCYISTEYMQRSEIASKKQFLMSANDYIRANCERADRKEHYTLNMAVQLSDPVFFDLANKLGIVEYLVQGIETVRIKMIELQGSQESPTVIKL